MVMTSHPFTDDVTSGFFHNGSQADLNQSLVITDRSLPTVSTAEEFGSIWTAREFIIVFTTPIIVLIGTIGNLISMAVLRRPRFAQLSTTIYLMALAVADTTFLYSNSMTKNFIKIVFRTNYSTVYGWSCAAYVYLLLCSKCLGAWFIVAVTLERLLVVCLPLKAKLIATRKRACSVVVALTCVVFSVYSYTLTVYEVSIDNNNKTGCDMKSYYVHKNIDVILKVMDLCLYSLIPSILLLFSNVVLIQKVRQSSQFRSASTGGATSRQQLDDGNNAKRLTVTLLLVSWTFLILTIPTGLFLTYSVSNVIDNFEIYYRSLYCLELANHAVNFFLYCLSGRAFRVEVTAMVQCGKTRPTDSRGDTYGTRSVSVSTLSGLVRTTGETVP